MSENELKEEGGKVLLQDNKLIYQWKKYVLPFDLGEPFKVLMGSDEDTLALVLEKLKTDGLGGKCAARTFRGTLSYHTALANNKRVNNLFREPFKPEISVERLEPIVVNVGASAILETVIRGYPIPLVTWRRENGDLVEPCSKYRFLRENEESITLIIKNIEHADEGKYIVEAKNQIASTFFEFNIIVKEPTKIVSKSEDLSFSADQVLKISYEIKGIPKPEVKYYKDGKQLFEDKRIQFQENNQKYTLIFQRTHLDDTGSYSISAFNELAQDTAFYYLKIFTKPKILKKIGADRKVHRRENFEFTVRVEARPRPEVKWFKDEEELISGCDCVEEQKDVYFYTFKVFGAESWDAGLYKFRVENIHGFAEDFVRIYAHYW